MCTFLSSSLVVVQFIFLQSCVISLSSFLRVLLLSHDGFRAVSRVDFLMCRGRGAFAVGSLSVVWFFFYTPRVLVVLRRGGAFSPRRVVFVAVALSPPRVISVVSSFLLS